MEEQVDNYRIETYHNPRVMGVYGVFGIAVGAAAYMMHNLIAKKSTADMTEMLDRTFDIHPKFEE